MAELVDKDFKITIINISYIFNESKENVSTTRREMEATKNTQEFKTALEDWWSGSSGRACVVSMRH
jgi:uncharacterized protein YcsI (UPF0317 family)